ncbi:hypothetical protein CYMTET_26249, partial [Cymbomonas tetramitiformis]
KDQLFPKPESKAESLPKAAGEVVVSESTLAENVAELAGGGSIMWNVQEAQGSAPEIGNTSVLRGNNASYGTGGGESLATEWRSFDVQLDEEAFQSVESGSAMPDVRFQYFDFYNSSVIFAQGIDPKVVVEMALVGGEGSPRLRGTTLVKYDGAGATISGVELTAYVGGTYTLKVGTDTNFVNVTAAVRQCQAGEYVKELDGNNQCKVCEEDTLGLKADVSACVSCEDTDGIECLGGSRYNISKGFWLSPAAAECDSASCLLSMVYECDIQEACDTDAAGRQGDDAEGVTQLKLCAEGHRTDVVICGSCEEGYNYQLGECIKCPDDKVTAWVQLVAVLIFAGFLMFILWKLAFRAGNLMIVGATHGKKMADKVNDQGDALMDIFAVLLGFLQVLGPTLDLFKTHIHSISLLTLASVVSWAGLPLGSMMSLGCLHYNVGVAMTSPFYREFVVKMISPFVCAAAFTVVYLYNNWLLARTVSADKEAGRETDEKFIQSCKTFMAMSVTLGLFVLQFLYPIVGIAAFELFHCNKFKLDDPNDDNQSWLSLDRSTECFTPNWWGYAAVSIFMIVFYILALPAAMAVGLSWLKTNRGYRVRMDPKIWAMVPPSWKRFMPDEQLKLLRSETMDVVLYCRKLHVEERGEDTFLKVALGVELEGSAVTTILIQDDGSELKHHNSLLDQSVVTLYFGKFYKPFEPAYYFWNSVILLRRLAQTGFIVIMKIFTSDQYAIVYALAIAIATVILQAEFAPFKSAMADRVEFLCLLDVMVVLFVFVMSEMVDPEDYHEQSGSDALFAVQMLLGIYIVWILIPIVKGKFLEVKGEVLAMLPKRMLNRLSWPGARKEREVSKVAEEERSAPATGDALSMEVLYTSNPLSEGDAVEEDGSVVLVDGDTETNIVQWQCLVEADIPDNSSLPSEQQNCVGDDDLKAPLRNSTLDHVIPFSAGGMPMVQPNAAARKTIIRLRSAEDETSPIKMPDRRISIDRGLGLAGPESAEAAP